jgi:hypothetical protein
MKLAKTDISVSKAGRGCMVKEGRACGISVYQFILDFK